MESDTDLTILMPCMNEESNIVFCIEQAQSYLKSIRDRSGCTGEILYRTGAVLSEINSRPFRLHRRNSGRRQLQHGPFR